MTFLLGKNSADYIILYCMDIITDDSDCEHVSYNCVFELISKAKKDLY